MALRLAGEQFSVLRGMDSVGWLREISPNDAVPGLKVNQQGTGRIVDFQDGGTSKLHLLDGGRVVVADSVEIGANPATTGAVRLANDQQIMARNAANLADGALLIGDSGNAVRLGGSATWATIVVGHSSQSKLSLLPAGVEFGTNPAASGLIRLTNNQAITARNGANTADIALLVLNTGNDVVLGDASAGGIRIMKLVFPDSDNTIDLGTSNRFRSLLVGTSVQVGANPAQSGLVRLANAGALSARNAANTADVALVQLDGSNRLDLGLNSLSLVLTGALTQTTVGAAGTASALPANPTGYLRVLIGGAERVIPFYAQA